MDIVVSIVILAYNRKDEVVKTVQLCLNDKYLSDHAEIIVVDNCSADGTIEALQTIYGSSITMLQTTENIGVAGWNKGFEVAKGRYLLVLDDDSHPEHGVEQAINFLDNNLNVGVLGLNIAGGAFTTEHIPDKFNWIGFIGCGAIIRKTVCDEIGGFADWLFIYTHEYEYGIRVIEAGYRILFFKAALVMHRTSALNRTNQRLVTYSTRNELLIVDKYFPERRSISLFKIKLKNIIRYLEAGGLGVIPHFLQGIKLYKQGKDDITAKRVSLATQAFYEQQFLPKHSIFTLLVFHLPKNLLKGLWYTLKNKATA